MHYGADYNPEQWPEELWPEDVARMREAGVTMVSLGIFSWSRIQPREGEFDFGWLDRVIDLLHEGGIAVDLATATASPPPWASAAYPELLPQDENGAVYWPGSRQQFAPSSPVYRRLAAELVTAIAERYAGHPAVVMWHVNNEYGCHLNMDFSDAARDAFRRWLGRSLRHGRRAERGVGHELLVAALRRTSTRCSRRARRPTATTPGRCSTSAGSRATCCSSATSWNARSSAPPGRPSRSRRTSWARSSPRTTRSGPSTWTSSATTATPTRTTPRASVPPRSSATSCGR